MQFVLTFGIKQSKLWWKASFNNEKSFDATEIIGNRNKELDSQVIEEGKATLCYDSYFPSCNVTVVWPLIIKKK